MSDYKGHPSVWVVVAAVDDDIKADWAVHVIFP